MAKFSYEDYANAVSRAQNTDGGKKIGWLKLPANGECVARFNISCVEELMFNSIHQLDASVNWMKVSCLNGIGGSADNCPLCQQVANGNKAIGKASKKVYVPMLVSYKDAATGTYSAPVAVVWERPALFSRDLASMIRDYGDLRESLFKITRTGTGLDTSYTVNYAPPQIFTDSMIPKDFSDFDNFNIAKHSYWEKSREDILAFLATGAFPTNQAPQAPMPTDADAPAYTKPIYDSMAIGHNPDSSKVSTAQPVTADHRPAPAPITEDVPFYMGSEEPTAAHAAQATAPVTHTTVAGKPPRQFIQF